MATRKKNGPAKPSSPASSGPAGAEFEAQVGAAYLLSMLVGSEPLGLPGTIIDSVELQRAGEGFPLDDVIIRAHDPAGHAATLQIQVKRSISFAPSDDVFRSVVGQIVEAANKPGFWDGKNELAVATARTSRKIDGAYQDVLTWARQLGSAKTFAARITGEGVASDDMRTFVSTFKANLKDFGHTDDDETVWKLLRRFQILIFDFTATGSASEALAKERSARALDPSESGRGGDLWSALTGLALDIAASGGDRTRETLRSDAALQQFRWSGEPRHLRALAALAENGAAALADIRDQISGVSISRAARVAEVHASLGLGRYVEIQGDAGVGKSGILKHFALQAATASGIIVLKPGRTTPRGWTALRAALSFDGTARELLVELAADGTGILFIDNLDLFSVEEQATVNDLLRAVATVPGFSVIATARRDFGGDERAWLAQDGLDQLGRAPSIVINELDDAEVKELSAAAPGLAGLLSATHPARDVTRNLFRLARLASRPKDAPVLRTETDMATEWWTTADGPPEGRRERERLLRFLAEQAVAGLSTFDVSSQPPAPVDSMIASETLRDYGSDRVGFRHDVLREWAIAKLIGIDEGTLQRFPLDKPASGFLARSIELHARSLIEGAQDDKAWLAFLNRLTGPGIHGSWRRAVLVALVRSEAAPKALQTAAPSLVAGHGALLNELIRTTMAVDVQPGREVLAASGMDASSIPDSFVVPSGPAWFRLIVWILKLGDRLPGGSVPDVVDLFNKWSMAIFGMDPLTPRLLERLHQWLTAIESIQDIRHSRDRPPLFDGVLTSDQVRTLTGELRRGFVMFASKVPQLAAEYLRAAKDRRDRETIATELHEFRGTLAQAAPEELAELFQAVLIPSPRPKGSSDYSGSAPRERIFTHFDSKYLPVSPAQGPFYDLLLARPEVGKRLIRNLVDHAIAARTRDFEGELESIDILTPNGTRRFLWPTTFSWPREAGSTDYAVTSGLMALEGWGHSRIEAGEPVETVIEDILGPGDVPAAYLLVAVDLVLSHWPASREAAIPYLGSPDLIILDRERKASESIEFPDFFGLKAMQREPFGPLTAKSLADRPSRKLELYDLLKQYTFGADTAQRERLVDLLKSAASALGSPAPDSNFGDPRFMVLHALNQLDPANWQPIEVEFTDGSTGQVQQYTSPKSEADHLEPFQADAQAKMLEVNIQQVAAKILDSPSLGNPEAVKALVEWGMARPLPDFADTVRGDRDLSAWALGEATMNIAMIAMRDGDDELRGKAREWAHLVFAARLAQPIDRVSGTLERLQFNPLAIAFVGLAFSLRDRAEEADIRQLLEIAAHESPAASKGFAVAASALAGIDERLLKSILRCALRARIFTHRDWELDEEVHEARKAELRQRVAGAIDRELGWLSGRGPEPDWPDFPFRDPQPRRGIRLGGDPAQPRQRRARSDENVESNGAADWLESLRQVADVSARPWLRDVINHYRDWTSDANGGGLEEDEEVDRAPGEWNDAYFSLMAACLPGLTAAEVDTFALDLIRALSSNAFLDVTATFLRKFDVIYLDKEVIDASIAVHVRQSLADALRGRHAWTHFARDRSASVEIHMGDAISAFLFHTYSSGFAPPKCYLLPDRAHKAHPLLPALETLAAEAATILVATETTTLLNVAPHPAQLPFAITVAKAWMQLRPDDTAFWVDYSIGRNLCLWFEKVREMQPASFEAGDPMRADIDEILAALVRVGVPDARRLETALSDT